VTGDDEFAKKWRTANARVRRIEQQISRAWSDFSSGRAGPPSRELMDKLARVRREADEELRAVLLAIQAKRKGGGSDKPEGSRRRGRDAHPR
jgi:hypothetical protein